MRGTSIVFLVLLTQAAAAQTTAPTSATIQPVQPANPQRQIVNRPAETSVRPEVLSAGDVDLYRRVFAAQRAGELSKAKKLFSEVSDTSLKGYVEAGRLLATKRAERDELVAWLTDYRELAIADKIYRAAVSHSAKRVKRGKKTIRVAVVTSIPVPSGVGMRSGGYEDAELPPPAPQSDVARAVWPQIQADIKAGQPDAALGRMRALIGAPDSDIATCPTALPLLTWQKAWTRPLLPWRKPPIPISCRTWNGMRAFPPIDWANMPMRSCIWKSWHRMARYRAKRGRGRPFGQRGP